MDPISEKFPHVTTYNYAENDPISHIDLWGLQQGPASGYLKHYLANYFEAVGEFIDAFKVSRTTTVKKSPPSGDRGPFKVQLSVGTSNSTTFGLNTSQLFNETNFNGKDNTLMLEGPVMTVENEVSEFKELKGTLSDKKAYGSVTHKEDMNSDGTTQTIEAGVTFGGGASLGGFYSKSNDGQGNESNKAGVKLSATVNNDAKNETSTTVSTSIYFETKKYK